MAKLEDADRMQCQIYIEKRGRFTAEVELFQKKLEAAQVEGRNNEIQFNIFQVELTKKYELSPKDTIDIATGQIVREDDAAKSTNSAAASSKHSAGHSSGNKKSKSKR